MKNTYVSQIDYKTGLIRGWGLVLYATLPASLAMLNILDIKIKIEDFKFEYLSFAIAPMLILFLLIRAKQKKWFLDKSFLNIRSIIILVIILTLSTIICGLALLIKSNYSLDFSLNGLFDGGFRAFLMAISSIVLSAALFMSILTKNVDLPGIPNQDIIDSFDKMRVKLLTIQDNGIWNSLEVNKKFPNDLLPSVIQLEKDLEEFNLISSKFIREDILQADIKSLKDKLIEINKKEGPAKEMIIVKTFKVFWDNKNVPESFERILTKKV